MKYKILERKTEHYIDECGRKKKRKMVRVECTRCHGKGGGPGFMEQGGSYRSGCPECKDYGGWWREDEQS